MTKPIDWTNKKINGLHVLKKLEIRNGHRYYKVKCTCGKIFETRSQSLHIGIKSCGCRNLDLKDLYNTKTNKLFITPKTKIINGNYHYFCKCDCGNKKWISRNNLQNNKTQSCGCLYKKPKTHGLTKHYLYHIWIGMKGRCYNHKNPKYKDYGGRGITICDRWLYGEDNEHPFICFIEDMGDRPPNLSLDRINVNGNYCPKNCRWADKYIQANNRRNSSKINEELIQKNKELKLEIQKLKEELSLFTQHV